MNTDLHERARMLIALSGPEGTSKAEQTWLAEHLASCEGCREFAESSSEMIRSLRSIPVTAGAGLVSATRIRVRERAQELQRRQERLAVVWVCCAAVTLCGGVTTAALWRWFAWIGQQARLPESVWGIGFIAFCTMPAILVGILLLARGTYMADYNGRYQE